MGQIACFVAPVWDLSAASGRVPGGWGLSTWPISVRSTPEQCRRMARAALAALDKRPKSKKNDPKGTTAPYTPPTTTPDDPTSTIWVVPGPNWDPKARVFYGHVPSVAMPQPGSTGEIITL